MYVGFRKRLQDASPCPAPASSQVDSQAGASAVEDAPQEQSLQEAGQAPGKRPRLADKLSAARGTSKRKSASAKPAPATRCDFALVHADSGKTFVEVKSATLSQQSALRHALLCALLSKTLYEGNAHAVVVLQCVSHSGATACIEHGPDTVAAET
jgi:hypothetical protein